MFFIHCKGQAGCSSIWNGHKVRRERSLFGSGLGICHIDELGDSLEQEMTEGLCGELRSRPDKTLNPSGNRPVSLVNREASVVRAGALLAGV